jgi:hypothetical protein
MFKSLLGTDFFKIVSDDANDGIIKNDRLSYKPIFDMIRTEIIEDSTKNNSLHNDKIVFSDVNKIINTTNKSDIIDDVEVESIMTIYTTHARKMATTVSNIIHKIHGKFVQLRAIIPNEEYDVMVNMRNLIKLYRIDRYKEVKLSTLFNTICIKKLWYFPAEVELIDIYHKLYLPNFNEDWNSLIKSESILYKQIQSNKIGGSKKCKDCKIKRKLSVYQIKLLLLKFLNNENFVCVGNWTHSIIENTSGNSDTNDEDFNIQIISENAIDQDYGNITNFLSEYTNYGIYYKKKRLYIPKDNRIFKYTFFIKYPTLGMTIVDKQFLDIYNCGSYELIPYIPMKYKDINLKIGNIFVQMRFLLIDLWHLKLIKHLNKINTDDFKTKYEYLFNAMHNLKKILPDGMKNSPDRYIGINFDEKIAQRIEISKKQIKRTSYYPEISIKNTKSYKLIATSSS